MKLVQKTYIGLQTAPAMWSSYVDVIRPDRRGCQGGPRVCGRLHPGGSSVYIEKSGWRSSRPRARIGVMRRFALLVGLSVAGAAAVVAGPVLVPGGPSASLDASSALQSGHLWVAAGLVFLGGLFTALTPCVYPLIPITVAVFGGQSAKE